MKDTQFGMYATLPGISLAEALDRVTSALQEEGFGILTRIDVAETLKMKIGAEHRPYVILGACNPSLAHRALTIDDNLGLMLPCNVVVAATDGGSEVAFVRPHAMMDIVAADGIREVADLAQEKLERALSATTQSASREA